MKTTIPIRYFAWSPLLLLGLFLGLGLGFEVIQSLQYEPDLIRWMTARGTKATLIALFPLYLFVGYGLLVARKYLGMSILTLWAFQLLVIAPLLAPSCSDAKRLERLGEWLGISFWDSVAGIAVIAALTSLALLLRFRTVPTLPMVRQRAYLRWFVLGAALVAMSLAAAAHWAALRLHDALLRSFGADFPAPTLVLLEYSKSWWTLPVVCVAALAFVSARNEYTTPELRWALNGAVSLSIALSVLAVVLLYSVYGSVVTMCGPV